MIVDSDDKPVEGADFMIEAGDDKTALFLDEYGTTGPDGSFSFKCLMPGAYRLHARADGFDEAKKDGVAAGAVDVRIAMTRKK